MDQRDLKKFMEYGRGRTETEIKPRKSLDSNFISTSQKPLSEIPDEEIYKKCQEYGTNARQWLRKFAGLLPEVAKRGLHGRKGFTSLGEFAGKVAGMSEYVVDRILQLHAKIKDKPALLKIFESGEEGWSKIDRITYVATVETDKFWAEKLKILSKSALEVYVQNYRLKFAPGRKPENENLFGQEVNRSIGGGDSLEPPVRFSFPASRDLEFDLRVAKQKMEKATKQNLTWNETFQMIIKKTDFEGPKREICVKCKTEKAKVKICEKCSKLLGAGGGHDQ